MQNIENRLYLGGTGSVNSNKFNGEVNIIPIHKVYNGIKDFTLGLLEQLINHLSRKRVNNYAIKNIIQELTYIIREGEEAYKILLQQQLERSITDGDKRAEIVQDVISQTNDKDLTTIEKIFLQHNLNFIFLNIPSIIYSPSMEYGEMRIIASFCYRALKKGLKREEWNIQKVSGQLNHIYSTLMITKDDILIDFDMSFIGSVEDFDRISIKEFSICWLPQIFIRRSLRVIRVNRDIKQIATLEGFSENSIEILMRIKQQSSYNLIDFEEIYSMYMRVIYKEIITIDPNFKSIEKLESIFEFVDESDMMIGYKSFYDKVNNKKLDAQKRLEALNTLLYLKGGVLQVLDNVIVAKRREANTRFLMSGKIE